MFLKLMGVSRLAVHSLQNRPAAWWLGRVVRVSDIWTAEAVLQQLSFIVAEDPTDDETCPGHGTAPAQF